MKFLLYTENIEKDACADRKSIGSFHVRHVAFSGRGAPKMLSICNSSREIEIPRFMKFIEHSLPNPLTQRAYTRIKPEAFSVVQIPGPGQLLAGYSIYTVYHLKLHFFTTTVFHFYMIGQERESKMIE